MERGRVGSSGEALESLGGMLWNPWSQTDMLMMVIKEMSRGGEKWTNLGGADK